MVCGPVISLTMPNEFRTTLSPATRMASVTTGSRPLVILSAPVEETMFRVPPVRKDRVLTWVSLALPPEASMFLRRIS